MANEIIQFTNPFPLRTNLTFLFITKNNEIEYEFTEISVAYEISSNEQSWSKFLIRISK